MARSMLLVHAHPDDESIWTGATIARYVADGVHVTLVMCTLGEAGEIAVPELAQLETAQADQLGGYRLTELRAACARLGVSNVRSLGGAGRYRDSGLVGAPANDHPRAFWRVDLDEVAAQLLEIIRDVRPQVLVTYDPTGSYGHPDHIQAHRVAMRAAELAGEDAPAKIYWTAGRELQREDDDAHVTTCINAAGFRDAKLAALVAHATQGIATEVAERLVPEHGCAELYTLAVGPRGPASGANGWEDDLFAGL